MDAKFAYMAGIIDGEGTVTFVKRLGKYFERGGVSARVIVTISDKRLVDWLVRQFGGSVSIRKMDSGKKIGTYTKRDYYMWYITSRQAIILLQKCYPYLIIKRKQAELLFEYYKTIQTGTTKIPRELAKKRLGIYYALRKLHESHGKVPHNNYLKPTFN